MGRPKSRAGSKAVQDSVTVATDPTPSPPTTRQKAAAGATAAESPKKTRKQGRSKNKPLEDDSDDNADDRKPSTPSPKKARKAPGKVTATSPTTTREAKKAASKTKKELDKSLRKAKRAVDDMVDSFDASSGYPLPGVLSPSVEHKGEVLRDIVALAIISSLLSSGARFTMEWLADSFEQTWMSGVLFFGTAGPLDIVPFAASVLARTTPIIYLLHSFYNVPITASFFAEILTINVETYVLEGYHFFKGTSDDDTEDDKERDDFFNLMKRDIITVVYPYTFAAVIYVFILVQACRFFLPEAFVVHFSGIKTVEPARVPSLLSASIPSVSDLFANIFLSFSAVVVSSLCGLFCRNYIFGFTKDAPRRNNTGFSRSAHIRRQTIDARTLACALSVGLSVYTQCLYEIPGVDNVGAAAFAAIWSAAPLAVSMGLIFTGI
ncbi:hypothetical protein Sste5344_010599 [Sporothrix stenoceras]